MDQHNAKLALYQELATLHRAMLASARAQDWDRLLQEEQQSVVLVNALRQLPAGQQAPREQAHRLIKETLALQEQIREAVSDWKTDVSPLLQALSPRP